MTEQPRRPVAIRIVRPYETADDFLANELETVGKTSVILIGAHPRQAGVILRFEVTLSSGETVLRGEGRVLAHKERAFRGQPGLSLRFTRLDPKSKALVDRAAAMREARLSGEMPSVRPSVPSHPPSDPTPEPPPIEETATVPLPLRRRSEPAPEPAPASLEDMPTHADTRESVPPAEPAPEPVPPAMAHEAPTAVMASLAPAVTQRVVDPPADRDALLVRLRERAAALASEDVEAILRRQPPR